ncbi:MAG TPA: PspA/IM30 family protein [Rhizobiaceae bacterium]|nr:PspA/IM30 family protein [Rhizobiaceae bacterium]
MFKQFLALVRGHSNEAGERLIDQNALVILRQQLRDCADAIAAARKAVAVAIAQNEQEVQQYKRLVERLGDLEGRTVIALGKGETALAREAAETIALLEAEKAISEEAQKNFTVEIDRLKRVVRAAESRLRELERGQRLATATDKTQRLRETGSGLTTLKDAEETLARLRARQKQIDGTASALAEMEQNGNPSAISEKLAAAGCGAPLTTTADAVLERLAKRVTQPATA